MQRPRSKGLVAGLVVVLGLLLFALWHTMSASAARKRADEPGGSPPVAEDQPGGAKSAPPAVNAALPTPPPRPSAPAPSAAAPDARPATPDSQLDEAHLMARLRAIKDQDPAAAILLAREGNRRFADSADAAERASILIHALVANDQGSEARAEAEEMVNHYPDSAWVREIEVFTGAHRHRNIRVNDAGVIEYY